MNYGRNELNEFYYGSALLTTGQFLTTPYSTADSTRNRTFRITDVKLSCATAATVQILGRGTSNKPIQIKMAANSTANFNWELPWKISVTSTTGTATGILASANTTGVYANISGYLE